MRLYFLKLPYLLVDLIFFRDSTFVKDVRGKGSNLSHISFEHNSNREFFLISHDFTCCCQ